MTVSRSHPGTAQSWQPIDMAPRDGTAFLAYWGPGIEGGATAIDIACWLDGNWCDPDNTEVHYGPFTFWHPLPAPPEAP